MTTQLALVAAIVTSLSTFGIHAVQDSDSAAAAGNLIRSLNDARLDAIATVDPTEPGAFVAALHIMGGQLLVVRAHQPSIEALSARLVARRFREVYIDLQATPMPKGKLFVNGARAQKLKDDEYRRQLQDADVKYTRLLNAFNAAVAQLSTQQVPQFQ
jgi:hypothetical protein